MQKNWKSILIICPYPLGYAPSQRFRFEQYLKLLQVNHYEIRIEPFLTAKTWGILYSKSNFWKLLFGVLNGYLRRITLLPSTKNYQYIFIHREATPFGPPWFEWATCKVFKRKVIYDFDDAIWMNDESNESSVVKALKWRKKIKLIIKWSWKISCGNQFLKEYATQFNNNVFLNPTTIDTENLHKATQNVDSIKKKIVIGWTGSHSTLRYLLQIDPVLHTLFQKYDFLELLIIANKKPNLPRTPFRYIEWNIQTEIDDLLKIDIGIMPLPNTEWAKGKCGFKLLQFMALNIPSVGTRIGTNTNILEQGVNGLLCETADEWLIALDKLINDPNLRHQIGKNGRKTVTQRYSVQSNECNFLSLFKL